MWRIDAIIIRNVFDLYKKKYIFNLLANVLKWLKNIMSCLHYIINILFHGINPGENIDSMADEVKKNRQYIYNHFVSTKLFVHVQTLHFYPYSRTSDIFVLENPP